MATSREIQELEIRVKTTGATRAKKELEDLSRTQDKVNKKMVRSARVTDKKMDRASLLGSAFINDSRRKRLSGIIKPTKSVSGRMNNVAIPEKYRKSYKIQQGISEQWKNKFQSTAIKPQVFSDMAKFYKEQNKEMIASRKEQFQSIGKKPQVMKDMATYYKALEKSSASEYKDMYKKAIDSEKAKLEIDKAHGKALEINKRYDKKRIDDYTRLFDKAIKTEDEKIAKEKAHKDKIAKEERRENARKAKLKLNEDKLRASIDERTKKEAFKKQYSEALRMDKEFNAKRSERAKKARQMAGFKTVPVRGSKLQGASLRPESMSDKINWMKGYSAFKQISAGVGQMANAITMSVGMLTMFAGAIMIVSMTARSAVEKVLMVGRAFGEVDRLSVANRNFNQYGTYDKAIALERRMSGASYATAGSNLSRSVSSLKEYGSTGSAFIAEKLVGAVHGLSAMTGDESETLIDKIIDVAKNGKDAKKLGLADLKMTRDIDRNIELIANAISKNSIAQEYMDSGGGIQSSLNRVIEAPKDLMESMLGRYGDFIRGTFSTFGDNMSKAFSRKDVIEAWSSSFANFNELVGDIFTEDKIAEALKGMAQWSAEFVDGSRLLLRKIQWLLENKDSVIEFGIMIGKAFLWIQGIKFFGGLIESIVGIGKALAWVGGAIGKMKTIEFATIATKLGGVSAGFGSIGTALTKLMPIIGMFLATSQTLGDGEEEKLDEYLKLEREKKANPYQDPMDRASEFFLKKVGDKGIQKTVIEVNGTVNLSSDMLVGESSYITSGGVY